METFDYQQTIIEAKKINATTVEVSFSNQQKMLLDFYGENIFRLFQDNSGKGLRSPKAEPKNKYYSTIREKKFQN